MSSRLSDLEIPESWIHGEERAIFHECAMDIKCMCIKSVLNTKTTIEREKTPEQVDSKASLDDRLTDCPEYLSKAEWRLSKKTPIKLFKNKVDRMWHKRYNYTLPENEQFDLQPYDEVQHRDEEIALEYFYGESIPSWLLDGSKDSQDSRIRILQRYNKEKRQAEEALLMEAQFVVHTRVESIISVNRTRAAETSVFGPSNAEKAKTLPTVRFMEKLVRLRQREKERHMIKIGKRSHWHYMKRNSTMDALMKIVEAERKVKAAQKFRRTIKVVRAVIRFIRVISIMSRDARHVLTEIHYFQEHQRLQTQQKINNIIAEGGLAASRDVFDPKKYHFSSRFKLSGDVRMILTKPWNLRSDEEVSKVVDRLQELRCFVEYPVSFQHKLARLAWLIEVAADLAIIREGHIAADFYFMLAGRAKMITLHGSPCLEEKGSFNTLRLLKNGDAFGDESMSHPDSERTYSVITTEKCILLSLSSVDYISMLLTTNDDEQAPEHIIFLSSLPFLKEFPKHKLIEEGEEYVRNYYLRAGSVISENLADSEYIYVVKYGSCKILVEIPPPGVTKDSKRNLCETLDKRRSSMHLRRLQELPMTTERPTKSSIYLSRISSTTEFIHQHKEDIANNPAAKAVIKGAVNNKTNKEFQLEKRESDILMKKSKKMFRSLRGSTIENLDDDLLQSYAKTVYEPKVPKSITEDTVGERSDSRSGTTRNDSSDSFAFRASGSSSMSVGGRSHSSRFNVEKHLSFVGLPNAKTPSRGQSKLAVGTNIDDIIDTPAQETSKRTKSAQDSSRSDTDTTGIKQRKKSINSQIASDCEIREKAKGHDSDDNIDAESAHEGKSNCTVCSVDRSSLAGVDRAGMSGKSKLPPIDKTNVSKEKPSHADAMPESSHWKVLQALVKGTKHPTARPKQYSRWKLIKTMVKGDFIGQEWVNLNRGPYDPPKEEMSLVSDGCEVIMMHREFLIKYLRKEL